MGAAASVDGEGNANEGGASMLGGLANEFAAEVNSNLTHRMIVI
jgi:hypothetical protein